MFPSCSKFKHDPLQTPSCLKQEVKWLDVLGLVFIIFTHNIQDIVCEIKNRARIPLTRNDGWEHNSWTGLDPNCFFSISQKASQRSALGYCWIDWNGFLLRSSTKLIKFIYSCCAFLPGRPAGTSAPSRHDAQGNRPLQTSLSYSTSRLMCQFVLKYSN